MPPSAAFVALQERYDALKAATYTPELKDLVTALVGDIPPITDATPRAEKVLVYILRAKSLLLLPTYSAEAEADLNRALKLDPSSSADTYVALSECLWRKNQEEEAIDAVQSALEIDEKHIGALCQMSRLVRALAAKSTAAPTTAGGSSSSNAAGASSTSAGTSSAVSSANSDAGASPAVAPKTEAERADLLQKSVTFAKKALSVDLKSGEAWSALGLAHIQVAVATGFGYAGLKKAVAAMQQAVAKCPNDPDVHYNYAVVLEATGAYALAAEEYATAARIDPLLKGANKSAEACRATIERHVSCAKEAAKNEPLKKELLFKLPAAKISPNGLVTVGSLADLAEVPAATLSGPGAGHAVSLMVVGLISPGGVYPLCYHCVDRNSQSCMLLVPRLQSSAIQKRDVVTVTIPPCSVATIEQKNVRSVDMASSAAAVNNISTTAAKKAKKYSPSSDDKAAGDSEEVITFASTIIAADPDAVMVNSVPVPDKLYTAASMSSRLFQ